MSEEGKSSSQADGKEIIFPDFAELWKELYFKTEGAWAEACKEIVSTETFVKMLDQTMNQHLSIEKITRQNMDKMFETSSVPSKKDLARLAELVISVEEKVDILDYQLVDNINKIADSMLGMIKLMEGNQQQLTDIKAQNTELQTQIKEMKKQNTAIKKQNTAIKKQIVEFQPQLIVSKTSNEGISKKNRSSKKKSISSEPAEQA